MSPLSLHGQSSSIFWDRRFLGNTPSLILVKPTQLSCPVLSQRTTVPQGCLLALPSEGCGLTEQYCFRAEHETSCSASFKVARGQAFLPVDSSYLLSPRYPGDDLCSGLLPIGREPGSALRFKSDESCWDCAPGVMVEGATQPANC